MHTHTPCAHTMRISNTLNSHKHSNIYIHTRSYPCTQTLRTHSQFHSHSSPCTHTLISHPPCTHTLIWLNTHYPHTLTLSTHTRLSLIHTHTIRLTTHTYSRSYMFIHTYVHFRIHTRYLYNLRSVLVFRKTRWMNTL
jgi:hypothetical protein